jgi:prophage DNA circulation protein
MTAATDALAAAATAFAEAVRATATDPADAVRLLGQLAVLAPPASSYSDGIGQAMTAAQTATAALMRRAALVSVGRACADYQPTSSNDATALLATATTMLDAEILTAADAGDDAGYQALRALRAAVVLDLTTRAASLPSLRTVTLPAPKPSLAVAYRLYRDTTREPDVTARAQAVHPGFLPTIFEALSR